MHQGPWEGLTLSPGSESRDTNLEMGGDSTEIAEIRGG